MQLYGYEKEVRERAGEILNDWDAVVSGLPCRRPTTTPPFGKLRSASRDVVIARRNRFDTRTDEGSRFHAPCRHRHLS